MEASRVGVGGGRSVCPESGDELAGESPASVVTRAASSCGLATIPTPSAGTRKKASTAVKLSHWRR